MFGLDIYTDVYKKTPGILVFFHPLGYLYDHQGQWFRYKRFFYI